MKKHRHCLKKLLALMLIVSLLFTAGCWDREELEELAYVLAMGIDYLPAEDKIEVTTAIIRPLNVAGGEQGGQGDMETFRLITTKGDTLSTAIEQQNAFLARRLYFAHNEVVIIGENLARRGLHPVLDRFVRERDLRMDIQFFVTSEAAKELMHAGAKIEEGMPLLLARWRERKDGQVLAPVVELRVFIKNLLNAGISPVLPRLSTREEVPISPQEAEITGDGEDLVIYPKVLGTAVFKGDKLAGFLNDDETNGLLYVQEDITDVTEVIEDPLGNPGEVVIFILRNSTRIIPLQIDGIPAVRIEVITEGEIC